MKPLKIIHEFHRFIWAAWYDAQNCHRFIFDESIKNEMFALSFATSVLSYISAAKAMCYSHLDYLERDETVGLLNHFFMFAITVRTNIVEIQSHESSAIKFEELKKAFEASSYNNPINE